MQNIAETVYIQNLYIYPSVLSYQENQSYLQYLNFPARIVKNPTK